MYLDLEDELTNWYRRSTADPFEQLWYGVHALHRATIQAADRHKKEMCGRGRPPKNEAMRNLIWQLADLFSRTGGRPDAWYRDDLGKRNSPFLRWVSAVNGCLPRSARVDAATLPELVHSVAKYRKKRLVIRQLEKP